MRKAFVFLVIAIIVFGYKVLPIKSAEYPCSCSVKFVVINAASEQCRSTDVIMVDYKSTVDSIVQKINAECNEMTLKPEPSYVSQMAEEILVRMSECERESMNKSANQYYGFTINCMQDLTVSPEALAEKAPVGKLAKELKSDAASRLNPAGLTVPAKLIGRFIKMLTAFIGSIALVLYIYAGILWMTARGHSERLEVARKTMVWTTLGVVVMLASYMLVSFVFKSLGL